MPGLRNPDLQAWHAWISTRSTRTGAEAERLLAWAFIAKCEHLASTLRR
ncbi:hypothetical protein [Burkholderia ubonensis]|nr:hypothetical protein [Burkholderia ubonensis]